MSQPPATAESADPFRWKLAPGRDEDGLVVWALDGQEAALEKTPSGWQWRRGELVLAVSGREAKPRLDFQARAGVGEAVIRLDPPVVLGPNRSVTLWVAWPLELLVVEHETGAEIDRWAPRRGRTVFGPVDGGQVLPAATCGLLEGPGTEPSEVPVAALRLSLENTTDTTVTVRRAPVDEGRLSLFRKGRRLAAGDVVVAVHLDHRAEAHTRPGEPPKGGFGTVVEGRRGEAAARLSWWLDSTRTSVEYQL